MPTFLTSRRLPWLAAALFLGLAGPVLAQTSVPALDFSTLGDGGFNYTQGSYSLGWRFTTNQNITITSLGFYDSLKDGIQGQHPVGIYDATSKKLLTSATVTSDAPLEGFFRYVTIPKLILPGGHDYYVVAVTGNEPYAVAVEDLTVNSAITFDGYAGNDPGLSNTTALLCPDPADDNPGFHGDFGPTFKIEPSSPNTVAAVEFVNPHDATGASISVGWAFSVAADTTVATLGYYDAGGDGLASSHEISLFDAETGTLILNSVITNTDPLRGNSRYHDVTAIHLLPGKSYYLMGVTGGNDPYADDVGTILGNAAVSYNGGVYNDTTNPNGAGFPNHTAANQTGFFGPNFEVVPAPGTVVTATVDQKTIHRDRHQAATITFTRTGDASFVTEVIYELSGPLRNGRDYAKLKGTKRIEIGSNRAQIKIKPLADGADGKVVVTVRDGESYTAGQSAKVKVQIVP